MPTFWERAAHPVYGMFSLYFNIVILVNSHFGCEGGTLVLIALVHGHCLSFTFACISFFTDTLDPTSIKLVVPSCSIETARWFKMMHHAMLR